MIGFKPRTSGIGSNLPTATSLPTNLASFCHKCMSWFKYRDRKRFFVKNKNYLLLPPDFSPINFIFLGQGRFKFCFWLKCFLLQLKDCVMETCIWCWLGGRFHDAKTWIFMRDFNRTKIFRWKAVWAVVVAQLAERLLPTPEVCGSNPVISKKFHRTIVYNQLHWKHENKEKEAVNGPFFKWKEKAKSSALLGRKYHPILYFVSQRNSPFQSWLNFFFVWNLSLVDIFYRCFYLLTTSSFSFVVVVVSSPKKEFF